MAPAAYPALLCRLHFSQVHHHTLLYTGAMLNRALLHPFEIGVGAVGGVQDLDSRSLLILPCCADQTILLTQVYVP